MLSAYDKGNKPFYIYGSSSNNTISYNTIEEAYNNLNNSYNSNVYIWTDDFGWYGRIHQRIKNENDKKVYENMDCFPMLLCLCIANLFWLLASALSLSSPDLDKENVHITVRLLLYFFLEYYWHYMLSYYFHSFLFSY